jgi:hypothetical protein
VLLQKWYGFKAHVFHAAGFNSKKEYEAKRAWIRSIHNCRSIDHPHTLIFVVHQTSSDRKLVCCAAHVMSHNELHRVQDIDVYDHIYKVLKPLNCALKTLKVLMQHAWTMPIC